MSDPHEYEVEFERIRAIWGIQDEPPPLERPPPEVNHDIYAVPSRTRSIPRRSREGSSSR